MTVGAGFRLSQVLIVESLEPHEVQTGAQIADFINAAEGSAASLGIAVEYRTCDNAPEFRAFLRSLTTHVRATGSIPLLHVECHGDENVGLEFCNGSVMSWLELSELLVELNRATRFNLVTVFSACYGAHFLSRVDSIDPAPCFAMIAPTAAVEPYELLAGFRTFYSTLLRSQDVAVAVGEILRLRLTEGVWFAHLAEFWYEEVAVRYVETQCTKPEMRRRALRMHRKLQSEGLSRDIGQLRRGLVQVNRHNLLVKFFDRYFMTVDIPENTQRFRAARKRIENRLSCLRRTGRYGV